jgi:hypothetical protein
VILEMNVSRDNARELIATATAMGHPSTVVQTTETGFRVPDDVGLAVLAPSPSEPKTLSKPRRSRSKTAQKE